MAETSTVSAVPEDEVLSVIVLGASGDLAKKKTYPALFGLFCQNLTGSRFNVVGFARTSMSTEEFRNKMKGKVCNGINCDSKKINEFLEKCHYVHGGYDDASAFTRLDEFLKTLEGGAKKANRLFYYALPPSVYLEVSQSIASGCPKPSGWARVVIEKPFGKDTETSRTLSRGLSQVFNEEQMYRIDHYLGKEMVLNLMVLRFANLFFSSFWNRNFISTVQITFKENIGTEGRGGYFDEFGIIRDVMQNHLLQMLTVVAMERPASLDDKDIRDEKVKVLRQMQPLKLEDVVLGQYGSSEDGTKPGYLDDEGVPKDSLTPTFASAVMRINNERWEGVPFILKCGKALDNRKTEIRIQLQNVPGNVFGCDTARNELVLRVQPKEAIYMKIVGKVPGIAMDLGQTELDLSYTSRYPTGQMPDAYERLILDVIRGDHANFVRDDELDAAWALFTPLLHQIESEKVKPIVYPFGSRGPQEGDDLAARHGYIRYAGYEWSKS
eukprot:GILJ01002820.1.p1 GENE.GILJ01002820.1~~GILJ01002820.1.p1  ORF type:complete len:496 (-),score=81.60 GILJ01002820.1:179-1666(-)